MEENRTESEIRHLCRVTFSRDWNFSEDSTKSRFKSLEITQPHHHLTGIQDDKPGQRFQDSRARRAALLPSLPQAKRGGNFKNF